MAKIIYAHPTKKGYKFHIFTNLDFWDTRKILRDLLDHLSVRRNFGKDPQGDEFPTQIISDNLPKNLVGVVEKRLKKAIPSPPRHVVTREMLMEGIFIFDPYKYYPKNWSKSKIEFFTLKRLPLDQSALCDPYHTVKLEWNENLLIVRKQQREKKYDPNIKTLAEYRRRVFTPSSF